jgi:hypothetical protein
VARATLRAGRFIVSSIPIPVDWPPRGPLIQCAAVTPISCDHSALRTQRRASLSAGVLTALVCASALLSPAPGDAAAPLTLAPEQLMPGDQAVVRSVFRGDSIEEFPAEIVGVLSGGRVDGQTIIARATSERLRRVGVAQGMSGSPVYVNGRLIGALASSWAFARDPLFGITPIREMLRLFERPASSATGPASGPAGVELTSLPGGVRFGEFHWEEDAPAEPMLTPGAAEARRGSFAGAPVSLPIPLACGGLAPAALDAAQQWFAPLGFTAVPGGSTPDGGPDAASLAPGSAVAVDLMRGDLQISAIGTLTWRDGDRVLLFGHPFFQSGDVRLPLSTARITTVVASEYLSFKLGSRGREVGIVTQDRRPGVSGMIGPRARLLPLAIHIEGARPAPQHFRFELVEDRMLAAQLTRLATLNSLLESGGTGPGQTLGWTLTLHRREMPPLVLQDLSAGESPTSEAASAITGPLEFLFGNPFERLRLDSIEVAIQLSPGRRSWTLRSARLLDAAVRPGGRARVECRIELWRGPTETRLIEVPVAAELPDGRYSLWVGGGAELSRHEAAHFPARYRPTSLADAWRRLGRIRSSGALYAAILAVAPDVTAAGRDYPELPASAAAVLSSGLAAGDLARRTEAALLDETRLPLGGVARGELEVVLTVDSKTP